MARKVSLYIPCYNAGKYLSRCMEGVSRQTYPIDELLVIDDGSSDQTADIARSYAAKVISHDGNKGIAAARNTAVSNARNGFLASLDADCVPAPEWLERLMQNFDDEKVAGAGGRLIETNVSSMPDKWRSVYMRQNWGEARIVNPRFLFGANNVFRKDALTAAGLYNAEYRTNNEDCDMSIRLRQNGHTLIYEPLAIVHHLRTDSLSSALNTHWRWTFFGITGTKRVPDSTYNMFCRTYDNLAYLFRDMLMDDIKSGRLDLLPVDILSFFHHFFADLQYYTSSKFKGLKKL